MGVSYYYVIQESQFHVFFTQLIRIDSYSIKRMIRILHNLMF